MSPGRRLTVAVLVLSALAGTQASLTAAQQPVPPSASLAPAVPPAAATRALRQAERLVSGAPGARGDATLAMMRLVRAYSSLTPHQQRRAGRVFARPTSRNDPEGSAYSVPEAAASPACTANFCVHWVQKGRDAPPLVDANGVADGDGIPDYVELNERVAEHVFAVENGKLGWRAPKSDGHRGGGLSKTDIYIVDLGGGLFGYAAPDRGQQRGRGIRRSLYGYLVVDDDYSRRQFPGTKPAEDLEVTLAHEYNHILQFTYDAFQDVWMAESTAVWMEDHVYDGINDYLRYMGRWARRTRVPLTANSIKVYGSAVWNHWLEHRYGAKTIRAAWARGKRLLAAGFSVASYRSAIRAVSRDGFNIDFARFARDVAEWRTDRVFAEGHAFPDAQRLGVLRPGAPPKLRRLNHATFQMLRLRVRDGRAVALRAATPRGVETGLALVGRIGSARHGRVVSRLRFRRHGGEIAVALSRPARFDRITAVLINADTAKRGFDGKRVDWNYLHDGARFRISAALVR